MVSAAAALGTLQLLHVRIAFHTDLVVYLVVHVSRRRKRLRRSTIR